MSAVKSYIGIDPGAGGALALFTPGETAGAGLVAIEDMPTMEIRGKRRIDLYRLANIIDLWKATHEIERACIENVGAMPGQAPNAMFSFGYACGAVQQAVASAGLPMVLVVPQVWKKVYGIPGGRENKDVSRQKACQMFPGVAHLLTRKRDDGRAESVLLAHYGVKIT